MTAMTMSRPASGDDWIRTADYHILAMPRRKPEDVAKELGLARRAVQRLGSQDEAELLDMLGLAIPAPATSETPPQPEPEKRCSRCEEWKPKTRFAKCSNYRDGLEYTCKDCQKTQRHAAYIANGGYRSSHDGKTDWGIAPPGGLGTPCSKDAVEARIGRWEDLRTRDHLGPRKAAERMQVSMRTARRYDRILKDRGLLPETDRSGRVVG